MADPTNSTVVDVELLAQGSNVTSAMDAIHAKLEKALAAVNKITASADVGSKKFEANLNRTVKNLQQVMSQISTLEKSMYAGAGGVRQLNQAQQFGKSTEAAARFAGTVKNAGTAVEAVGARINDLTKKMARLGQQDFLPKQRMLRAQSDLRAVEKEVRSVGAAMERLNTKARLNGGDFSAQQRQVAEAQASLFRALKDGRRTNFTAELNQLRDAMARYGVDIRTVDADLRRQGQAYDQLIAKARQYTNETRFQREGRLRREAGRLGVPEGVSTGGAVERLAQATLRAANAKERLNVALRSNAGQAELSKAVADYERYNAELVESVALHNRLQRELKESAAAETRQAAEAARAQAQTNRRGIVGHILSPEYGAAAFARTSVYGAAAAAAYGVFNTLRDGARFVVEFEDALANLQAVAGATSGQMVELQATILDIGSSSKFSTLEITEAAQQLAQAGFSTEEMEKALGAVTRLAAASGASIKESSDLLTATIGGFQLQASEAERVADAMTAALNRSRLTVQQAALAVQYIGATAHDANISMNDVLASAGALAQAGIRSGSTIGTGLRTFLTDLIDPSEKLKKQLDALGLTMADVDVKTRGLRPVMETLRDAGFSSAQAYGSLELRAAAAYMTLSQNLDVMDDLNMAMLQQGTATEAAERSMDSLSAQWQRFLNIVGAELYSRDGQKGLTGLLKDVNDLIEAYDANKRAAQDWATDLQKSYDQAVASGDHLKATWDGLKISFVSFHDELAGAGLLPVEPIFRSAAESAADLDTQIAKTNEVLAANSVKLGAVDEAIGNLLVKQDSLSSNHAALSAELLQLGQRFDGLSEKLMGNVQSFQAALGALRQYRSEVLSFQVTQLGIQKTQLAQNYETQRATYISADRGLSGIPDKEFQRLRRAMTSAVANGSMEERVRATQAFSDYTEGRLDPRYRGRARASVLATGNLNLNVQQYASNNRALDEARFNASPNGSSLADSGAVVSAQITRNQANTGNKSRAELKRWFSDTAARAADVADAARRDAAKAPTAGARAALLEQAAYWDGLAGQANAAAKPTDKETKEAEKATKAAQRAGAREARRRLRGNKFVSQAGLKTADMDLKQALDDNAEPLNLDQFLDGAAEVDKQLQLWTSERMKLIEAEIKEKGLTGEAADTYRREIGEQIQNRKEETEKKLADAIIAMVQNSLEAAERQFSEGMRPFEYGLALAGARIQRLDRTDMVGRVPDYVRQNAEFRKEQMEENAAREQARLNDVKIAAHEKAIEDLSVAIASRQSTLEAPGAGNYDASNGIVVTAQTDEATRRFSGKTLKELQDEAYNAQQALFNLRTENDALKASLDGAAEIPATIGAAFNEAATAYARIGGLNVSLRESINNNLYGAIEQAHGAFTTFWDDMLRRPQDVLNNLKNFALSVVRTLQEMASKVLANQIFNSLLSIGASLIGGAPPGNAGGMDLRGFHLFNGGLVGRAEGGLVTEGVPNRDSVATKLARHEFVVQKSAVDSVGVDFMRDLNRRGARALQGLNSNVIPLKPTNVETNVYVIPPTEKPQLGPHDVIAVIDDALMRESSTKKLIKHVSNGG